MINWIKKLFGITSPSRLTLPTDLKLVSDERKIFYVCDRGLHCRRECPDCCLHTSNISYAKYDKHLDFVTQGNYLFEKVRGE